MSDTARDPIMLVFAGPNGSGKSTITSGFYVIGQYVNADEIQTELGCTSLEAARTAEATREYLLSERMDFTFETLLSTDRNYILMEKAKEKGYSIACIFVLTTDPQINVERVIKRNRWNGNDVPPEKVVERYCRSLKLFPRLFELCDELYVYDNSRDRTEGEPHKIIQKANGVTEVYPSDVWSLQMIKKLCQGRYAEKFEAGLT